MPSYSRENPSPRYFELVEQHTRAHMYPGIVGDLTFVGKKMLGNIVDIKRLILKTGSQTILDYGSGKGLLYKKNVIIAPTEGPSISLKDYWDVEDIICYDPCYPPYSQLPTGKYDGVICIDVLEHCPEEDLPWIIREIFSYANLFVFANIACYSAIKKFPNGENVHATIRPPKWWKELVKDVAKDFPEICWEIDAIVLLGDGKGLGKKVYRSK